LGGLIILYEPTRFKSDALPGNNYLKADAYFNEE